jgi:hypothetical protein
MKPGWIVLGVIGVGIVAVAFSPKGDSSRPPSSAIVKAGDCKLSEQEIRQLWVTLKVARNYNEAQAVAATQQMARDAERACEERKTWKPTPLPPELQKLAR